MMIVTDCVYFSGMKELAVCNLANAEKASLIGTKFRQIRQKPSMCLS